MNKLNNLSRKQLRNRKNSLKNKARAMNKKLKVIRSGIEDVTVELLARDIIAGDRL